MGCLGIFAVVLSVGLFGATTVEPVLLVPAILFLVIGVVTLLAERAWARADADEYRQRLANYEMRKQHYNAALIAYHLRQPPPPGVPRRRDWRQ